MWAWAVLTSLAGIGVGMWMPVLDHPKRQILGWTIVVIVVVWVSKFGRSTLGLALAFFVAIVVLFGMVL